MSFRSLFPASAAILLALASPLHAQPVAPSSESPISPGTAATTTTTTPAPSGAAAPKAGDKTAAAKPNSTTTTALTSPTVAAQKMIELAVQRMNLNDVNGALEALTQALNLNPNSTGAYVLRASIYSQRHQWKQAEDDFNAASRIAPTNVVLKFQVIEIKFMQKNFDEARAGFAALEKDPEMGDYAKYRVFLCDLYGGHQDVAKKELDVFDDAMGDPSYYFANAAWDLYHKNIDDARNWLLSASRIYPAGKFTMYGQPLRDLGYLPIPEPKDDAN